MGQLIDRVLLVDDEPLIRNLISGYLVAEGFVVRTAVDGLDALGKLRAGLPDLIVSDLDMPRMSGVEFLNIVRKRFPQIPVIVISGAAPDDVPEGVAADAYFHKNGLGFEQLLCTILALTGKPPVRTASPHNESRPAQAIWDGDGHYTMSCDECLRVFRVPRAFNLGRKEKWTACVHCGRSVWFQVDEEAPPDPARA